MKDLSVAILGKSLLGVDGCTFDASSEASRSKDRTKKRASKVRV
jgi:hypothetical protein